MRYMCYSSTCPAAVASIALTFAAAAAVTFAAAFTFAAVRRRRRRRPAHQPSCADIRHG